MHLLQVVRHTGYRLVAHMVTSWLQADYRLVTGRWQRGGRARGGQGAPAGRLVEASMTHTAHTSSG